MYNGIGLQTARGSGTNGYVQKNLSHLSPRDPLPGINEAEAKARVVTPDAGILDHERRRKIELECLELQDELEERGLPDDEIRARVDSLRQGLRARLARAPADYGHATHAEAKKLRPSDTHARGAAKARELQGMERALRIHPQYDEERVFDPAWHEQRRQERHAARASHRSTRDWDDRPRDAGYASRHAHVAARERARDAPDRPSDTSMPSPPRHDLRQVRAYDDDAPVPVPSRTPSPPPLHPADSATCE
ncbi:RNA-splicing factor [Malassezia nana]|uniref:RNA-splicing factor n=1 Tax=Malassezia nana TaxID=180528 RepID=A0AAF0J124_9BASI|nr:RNA-splicing factor [Malassezia nana]